MSKDTRIFRVNKNGKIRYCTRTSVSAMFGQGRYGLGVFTVEATNAEATAGWTDVTEEFRNPVRAKIFCPSHPTYTGMHRTRRHYSDEGCTCWDMFADNHPGYPKHLMFCDTPGKDPQECACRMTVKLLGE